MPSRSDDTRFDRTVRWFKDHPLFAVVLVIGLAIIVLGQVIESVRSVGGLFSSPAETAVLPTPANDRDGGAPADPSNELLDQFTGPAPSALDGQAPGAESPTLSDPAGEPPTAVEPREPSPRTTPSPVIEETELPVELTLRNGEQRTFLRDRASVAAEFNRIGDEEFVSLRVSAADGESVPYAVLGAGGRYRLRVDGIDCWIYVLSVDEARQTVVVRISRS